ncbi:hypothetical protein E2C01_027456 [Portunus trituberculatus]|uniref:Uncharacterized protein n=1 Tax=Portunus trituberculatus TaxID=210409 RepID=A0A5B7EI63_PORTR|nr:hypothetical protein [Portunus trituberculatus]
MALRTVSSSPRNFMDTTGFRFSSSSYTNGMPVGRFRPMMASSDMAATKCCVYFTAPFNGFQCDLSKVLSFNTTHLLFTVFLGSLGLVEASKATIVTLIETPGLLNGDVLLVDLLQNGLKSLVGPGQYRGVGKVKLEASILQCLPSSMSLLHTCRQNHPLSCA